MHAESENDHGSRQWLNIMALHSEACANGGTERGQGMDTMTEAHNSRSDQARWDAKTIQAFAEADDLHVSPFREDGKTYGTPTWIWSVVVDGSLYARAVHGTKSSWNHAAVTQGAGRIRLAGGVHEVTFTAITDQSLWDRIDGAYGEKYAGSPYLKDVTGQVQRESTVRIDPRE